GAPALVVDGGGGLGDELPESVQNVLADLCATVPIELLRHELLGLVRAPRGGRGRSETGADRARLVVEGDRERAHRDHHRVPRPDLRELLAPVRGRHVERRDQLIRLEYVALRAGDEVLDRDGARAAGRGDLNTRAGCVEGRQRVAG